MKIFEHPNMTEFKCPICNTGDDEPVTLIGIGGTQEGRNIQAEQVHVDCVNLRIYTLSGGVKYLFQYLK